MAYRMRIRISVDVDILSDDSQNAFAALEKLKQELRRFKPSSELIKVVDANTNALLKEESF